MAGPPDFDDHGNRLTPEDARRRAAERKAGRDLESARLKAAGRFAQEHYRDFMAETANGEDDGPTDYDVCAPQDKSSRDEWLRKTDPEPPARTRREWKKMAKVVQFQPDPNYVPPGEPDAPPKFNHVINPADWEKNPEPEELKSIVPGYILDETVTLFSADGGSGKSYLELQLAIARALAKEWIGLLPAPGRTLVLSTEDDDREMKRRMHSILQFYKSDARPFGARWADLGDNIRLVDLVGEDSILATLGKSGSFEPTKVFHALDDLMTEFKPGLTALDVLVSFFSGEERNRTHVRQFANLLLALCRKHKSAILLLAHPSLTGMSTGTGLSGSTDWHNVFRSRAYIDTVKDDGGERLFFRGKKNNYGVRGEDIELEYKGGLFVPVRGLTGLTKLASETAINDLFLTILKRFNAQGRNASDITGKSYAPALFSQDPDGRGITSKQFEGAMNRLFKDNKIEKQNNGSKSRPQNTLVPTEGNENAD